MGDVDELEGKFAISDHADAAARLLLEVVRELRVGVNPDQLAARTQNIARVMARTF